MRGRLMLRMLKAETSKINDLEKEECVQELP